VQHHVSAVWISGVWQQSIATWAAVFATFMDYLERHIRFDSEEHTPMARKVLASLCGDDDGKRRQCEETVNTAPAARARL
jgi:Protein of unknown function (DUF3050)